jgi:uncharacterized membrane protein (UPF0127 family)
VDLIRADGGERLWRLEVAGSWLARLRGLIGRRGLGPGEGLFLPGSNGVHMFFMRFPIDCIFLGAARPDGSRQVLALREGLAPWTGIVWWVSGADGAVEVAAGSLARAGLRRGDAVSLRDPAGLSGWATRSRR